jgi:hypothetical protein
MINKKPILRAGDPAFVRDLKTSVLQIYERLERQKMRGDGATFAVQEGPGGTTGHALLDSVRIAKLTVNNDDGTYDGTEQVWDDSADAWTDDPKGFSFGTSPIPALRPIDGRDDLDVTNDDMYVVVWQHVGDDGENNWFFSMSAIPPGDYDGDSLRWNDTDELWEANSLLEIGADSVKIWDDPDGATRADHVEIKHDGTSGYMHTDSGDLHLQNTAHADVWLFSGAASDETPSLKQSGYASGDQLRTWRLTVGEDGANTVSQYLDSYWISHDDFVNHNCFRGERAGEANTGDYVTATGYLAAYQNTGTRVTAAGYYAAFDNTGDYVTATGYLAAYQNTGARVTAAGYYAAYDNSGTRVTATGHLAAYQNTGARVTAAGYSAAYDNTGHRATVYGYDCGNGNTYDDVLLLGYDLDASAANEFMLGNSNSNSTPLLQGDLAELSLTLGAGDENNDLPVFQIDGYPSSESLQSFTMGHTAAGVFTFDQDTDVIETQMLLGGSTNQYRLAVENSDGDSVFEVNGDGEAYVERRLGVGTAPTKLFTCYSTPNERFGVESDGTVTINDAFSFPNDDGSEDQALLTDGSGSLSWQDVLVQAGTYIDVSGSTVSVDFTEVSGYNAAAYQFLVNNNSSFTWTALSEGDYIDISDNEIAVDLTEVAGYNAANNQALIHETGTLTWKDLTTDDAMTDLRVDTTNLTFDEKHRSLYMIDAGTESGWTTWHTGDDCS